MKEWEINGEGKMHFPDGQSCDYHSISQTTVNTAPQNTASGQVPSKTWMGLRGNSVLDLREYYLSHVKTRTRIPRSRATIVLHQAFECLSVFSVCLFTSNLASRKRDWLIFEREIDTLDAFVQVGKKWISTVFPNQIKVGKK